MALSLLGAELVLVLVLVPITHLACVYLCVCMCGYLAADSTGDLPHGTTRSSWYHGEIPKICPLSSASVSAYHTSGLCVPMCAYVCLCVGISPQIAEVIYPIIPPDLAGIMARYQKSAHISARPQPRHGNIGRKDKKTKEQHQGFQRGPPP